MKKDNKTSKTSEEEVMDISSLPEWGKLSDQKKKFIRFYLSNNFNASDAARKAGSKSKTPEQIGYQWLKDPNVETVVSVAKQNAATDNALTVEEVIGKARQVFDRSFQLDDMQNAKDMVKELAKWVQLDVQRRETVNYSVTKDLSPKEKQRKLENVKKLIEINKAPEKIKEDWE